MPLPQYPSYELNPLLNKEKLFEFTPPSTIDSQSEILPLPSEWLKELENFCRKEKEDLTKNCFDRHLAPFSIYALNMRVGPSQSLIEGLQLIFRRLRGDLDFSLGPLSTSDRKSIIDKLIEDIETCTDGFENRVKHINTAFEMPKNLPQLLYQVRKGLVENASASLTGEIHAWNRVTKVAAAQGVGIKANFDEDAYRGNLSEEKIIDALKKEFKEKFVPFNLPNLLADQVRGLLAHQGYTGPQPEGYSGGAAERLAEQIKGYLSKEIVGGMDWQDFYIDVGEGEFDIVLRDLNWKLIKQCFFYSLTQENYFFQRPPSQEAIANPINNLLDCASFSHLFSAQDHLIGTEHQCFDENSLFHLKKIKADFPIFWQNLRQGFETDPDLQEKIPLFFSELEKAPLHYSTIEKIVALFDLNLMTLTDDASLWDLAAKLIQKKTDDYNILMLAASKHPEALNVILKFLAEHPSLLDKETLQQMFLHSDKNGCNALMLAAYRNPKGFDFLLKFIIDYPDLIDKDTLQQMFLHKDKEGCNALMLAAFSHSNGLDSLLKFIADHPDLINKNSLREMLLQSNRKGCNALMMAALGNPSGLQLLLKFLSDRSIPIDKETLQQLFSQKITNVQDIIKYFCLLLLFLNHDHLDQLNLGFLISTIKSHDCNALTLAALYQPGGFKALLKFAAEHSHLFDEQTLKQVIAKNTGYGWNFFIIKAFLDNYLAGLSDRKAQDITHTTRFFKHNFGYSTQEKEIAALKLKEMLDTGLEKPEFVDDLLHLKQAYPALRNGRLGQLFDLCHNVASDETARAEVRNILIGLQRSVSHGVTTKPLARR